MTRLRRSRRARPLTRVRAIEPGQRSRVALSSQTVLTSGAAETTGVSEGTDAATVGAVSSLIDFTITTPADEQTRLLKLQSVTKSLTEAMLRSQVIGGEARQAAAARVSASVQSDDAAALAERAIKAAAPFGTASSEIGEFLVAAADLQDGEDPLVLDVQLTVFQNDMLASLPDTPVTLGTPFQQVITNHRFAERFAE